MWQKVVLIAILFIALFIGLWVNNQRQSARLDEMAGKLETTQKELTAAKAEIEQLNQTAARQTEAQNILFDRINEGAKSYVQKVHEIETDDGACEWLDALLPDSVRKYYGCNPSGAGDDTAPADPVAAMLKASARIHDN